MLSVLSQAFLVRCEEGSAAHARIDVTVLILSHLLRGDIIRDHSLGRALCSETCQIVIFRIFVDVVLIQNIDELRECRCDPDTLLILDALNALSQHFLDDHREVISQLSFRHLIQIHIYCDERSLSVGRHERDDLILDHLNAAVDFLADAHLGDAVDLLFCRLHMRLGELLADFLAESLTADFYERNQMGQRDALSAVLGTGDLCNGLCRNVAGRREAVRLLDHRLGDDRAVLEHILEIDQAAVMHVLCKIVGVMEVDNTLLMCTDHFVRKKESSRQVAADFSGHIIALYTVDSRILVGVLLLHFLIAALDQAEDLVIRRIGLAYKRMLIAIGDILSRHLVASGTHDAVLDHVLDLLDIGCAGETLAVILNFALNVLDLAGAQPHLLGDFLIRSLYRGGDLATVENHFLTASLDYLHNKLHSSASCRTFPRLSDLHPDHSLNCLAITMIPVYLFDTRLCVFPQKRHYILWCIKMILYEGMDFKR